MGHRMYRRDPSLDPIQDTERRNRALTQTPGPPDTPSCGEPPPALIYSSPLPPTPTFPPLHPPTVGGRARADGATRRLVELVEKELSLPDDKKARTLHGINRIVRRDIREPEVTPNVNLNPYYPSYARTP
jgi:hypothetical protein